MASLDGMNLFDKEPPCLTSSHIFRRPASLDKSFRTSFSIPISEECRPLPSRDVPFLPHLKLSQFDMVEVLRRNKYGNEWKGKPNQRLKDEFQLPDDVLLKSERVLLRRRQKQFQITNGIRIHARASCHPNITSSFGYFKCRGRMYSVVEYVEGRSLLRASQYFRRGMPQYIAVGIMVQLFEAAEYLHQNKMAHRDIRLENIAIEDTDDILAGSIPHVKLAEFGYSCTWNTVGGSGNLKTDFVGSRQYAPPEIQLQVPYCPKALDIYCLGSVFYRLLSSKSPSWSSREAPWRSRESLVSGRYIKFDEYAFDGKSEDVLNLVSDCINWYAGRRPNAREALGRLKSLRMKYHGRDGLRI